MARDHLRGCAMFQVVTRLSLQMPALGPRPVHVGFMMDKVALVQVSRQVLWFSL